LQSEEFHFSLWPGAISRSGRAGYMNLIHRQAPQGMFFLNLRHFNAEKHI